MASSDTSTTGIKKTDEQHSSSVRSVRISSVLKDIAFPQQGRNGGHHYALRELRRRRLQRCILISERKVERVTAEIRSAQRELHELNLLMEIKQRNISLADVNAVDPASARGLAEAAVETLTSQREVFELKVQEEELKLEDIRDLVGELDISVDQASLQCEEIVSGTYASGM